MIRHISRFIAFILLIASLASCSSNLGDSSEDARFASKIDWIGEGVWLKADTHLHTKFSDGRHTVDELAEKATEFECDVIAITDHADSKLRAATPEYLAAIEDARGKYPNLIVIAGLEWNIPPWNGDDHATVLFPPGMDNSESMTLFKARFDDYKRATHEQALADEGLRWLSQQASSNSVTPVVMFNHPCRKWDTAAELLGPLEHFSSVNDLFVGFSGAPGHQAAKKLGAYSYKVKLVDRWDPVAAEVGGVWDTLLKKGIDLWGARAPSDFHKTTGSESDYWPGQFSETWIYAPDRSAEGVFRALSAGSFFAVHGHMAREVQLEVNCAGLERPATPGEVIEVPRGASITVTLNLRVPLVDWSGAENRLDEVELIAIQADGAETVVKQPPAARSPLLEHTITVPDDGIVLRARGRRVVEAGPDLMFYTNPVRVRTLK